MDCQSGRIDITNYYKEITIHDFNNKDSKVNNNASDDEVEKEVNDHRDKHLVSKLVPIEKGKLHDQIETQAGALLLGKSNEKKEISWIK